MQRCWAISLTLAIGVVLVPRVAHLAGVLAQPTTPPRRRRRFAIPRKIGDAGH